MDPYKFLRITRNPDGSLTRPTIVPLSSPSAAAAGEPGPPLAVLSKDVPLNPSHATWLRIFLPNSTSSPGSGQDEVPQPPQKLPVLLYFHGGGFILYSAATAPFHDSCCRIARELPAVVVSVEYRLAPEHRLPAAYDDAVDAVRWLRRQAAAVPEADPWLRDRADFSRCFLAGSSSGGNIAYHAARRLLVDDPEDLRPLQLRGLLLNQPFFGSVERTPSEAASAGDKIVPFPVSDLMWELSLPEGADRDHVFCNPMLHHRRRGREEKTAAAEVPLLPRCLVRGYVGDPLIDGQREFVAMMEEQAEGTVALLDREGFHGVELLDRSKADLYIADVKSFVCSSSHPSLPHDAATTPHAAAEGTDPVASPSKY